MLFVHEDVRGIIWAKNPSHLVPSVLSEPHANPTVAWSASSPRLCDVAGNS